jgi:hypothetical protein
MTVETADLVLYIITGIACIIWMIAFRVLWGMDHPRSQRQLAQREEADQYDVRQDSSSRRDADSQLVSIALGKTQVAGNFEELSLRLARQVALRLPAAKIVSQTANELVLGPTAAGRWLGFERIDVRFLPLGENLTEVEHNVWQRPPRAPRWAWFLSGLGLVVIVVAYLFIKAFVVSHPNAAIRWQTVQMVQVIHFLWPPMLARIPAKASKTAGKAVAGVLEGMITNLPYVESTSVA